jgi:hypothetical protein
MWGNWSTLAPNISIRWAPVILVYSPKSLAIWPIVINLSGVIYPPAMREITE